MRYLFLLLLSTLSALSAQELPFFLSTHGGYEPVSVARELNSDTLSSGEFLAVYSRISLDGSNDDVVVYKIDRTTATIVDSVYLGGTADEFSGYLVTAPGDRIFVAVSSISLTANNLSDVQVYELNEELEIVNDFTIDNGPYDVIQDLGTAGPDRLTLFVRERLDEVGAPFTFRFITVNATDGSELSSVDASDFMNVDDRVMMSSDGGDLLMTAYLNVDNDVVLKLFDVTDGSIITELTGVVMADCPAGGQYLLLNDAAYATEDEVFQIVNTCLDVLEIGTDGNINLVENNIVTASGIVVNAWVQSSANGISVYSDNQSLELVRAGGGYSISQFVDYGDFVRVPEGPVLDSSYLSLVRPRIGVVSLAADAVTDTEVDNFGSGITGVFTSNEFISLDPDNEELVILERAASAYSALFYDLEGNLLDTLLLTEDINANPSNFIVGDNGRIETLISNANDFPGPRTVSVVEFSRASGTINEVFSLETPGTLPFLFHRLEKYANGDYLIKYLSLASFPFVQKILRVDPAGNVVFETELPSDLDDFILEPLTLDNAGNLYTFFPQRADSRLISLDENGNTRYDLNLGLTTILPNRNPSIQLNDAEDRLLVAGNGRDVDAVNVSYVLQFDPATGDLLEETVINMEGEDFVGQTVADYQRGSDSIVVMASGFLGTDVPLDERLVLRFSQLDENGEVYFERNLLAGYFDIPSLRDILTTDDFNAYAVGNLSDQALNTIRSVLVGVNFDDVVSVEEVPDLARTAKLTVAPNPTADLSTLSWDNVTRTEYDVQLLTNDGRLLANWSGVVEAGRARLNLRLGHLPGGTYVARLTTPSGVSTQRIVKR